jgi:hypothetical protein
MFDPTVASDEKMLDLYNEVTKEATNRWKRAMRDGGQLIARRNKEKQILQGVCAAHQREIGYRTVDRRTRPISNNQRVGQSSHQHRCKQSTMEIQHLKKETNKLRNYIVKQSGTIKM